MMEARFQTRVGTFELDVDFKAPGGITCIFGPSGSGKTTILRCLAGLRRSTGRMVVGDETWLDETRFVPPHERRVGYVSQESALFPHLDVEGNLKFAAKRAGQASIIDTAKSLGVDGLLKRETGSLSGGERQRVAIARALLSSPKLLLLDEPVAALDSASRDEVLRHLERLTLPLVHVSHSLEEVARLADHLVLLKDGKVRAEGTPSALLARLDVGGELGDDAGGVLSATVKTHDEGDHITELEGPWGPIYVGRLDEAPGARVRVRIRARDVSLSVEEGAKTSILNIFRMKILDLADAGPGQMLVRLGGPEEALLARITSRSASLLDLKPGLDVFARVKSVSLTRRA